MSSSWAATATCARGLPGERETIETGLVMRSIGYVGSPLLGVIGTNKRDGLATTSLLLEDQAAGILPEPLGDRDDLLARAKPG